MQKILVLILVLFLIITLILFLNSFQKKKQGQVCFKNYCFEVKIARTIAQRAKGLMFREKIENNQGMLFVFKSEKKYSFWMKNVSFPLDIIWLNADKKVVFISPSTQPCNNSECVAIKPTTKAQYVLEINKGLVKEIGLKIGDQLIVEY